MPVRSESVIGQVAEAARHRQPLFSVTVSPRLARFLIAAGAQPAARADVLVDEALSTAAGVPAMSEQEARRLAARLASDAAGPLVAGGGRGGAMRKMAVYLGLVEDKDDDRHDDDWEEQAGQPTPGTAWRADFSHVQTIRPRSYNEARVIGEAFRDGSPLVMDLAEMEDSDAKRIVDFVAGLIFGLRGSIERVTDRVFVLTPADVPSAEEAATHDVRGHEVQA